MGPDRVSAAHLSVRVSELYASNKLVFDARKSDELSEIYVKASEHVVSELGVNEQKEWSDYGSGFASFYDSWFYKNEDQFIVRSDGIEGSCYRGVFVLFSLLEPMFTVGEGIKNWNENGSGSYLPDIEMVDAYESKHVRELSQRICRVLRDFGIPQASKRTLDERIDTSIQIDTNMNYGPLKLLRCFLSLDGLVFALKQTMKTKVWNADFRPRAVAGKVRNSSIVNSKRTRVSVACRSF